ncbi:hypothetical protein M3P05_00710 [Sansalvadorimonas sp. 2012CJ34-2]|uniref:Uncharacterized protein n=1 Tax=Parendozoicomonas callyspongiae TaxID=2942213 RepID=A0ABT0PB88_9GAMM|nr:hypothetical protein [Sansalvadorimonas sp. 2012CJ34-2]MCL6268471.1 hypothetical protein [Sansalvadorimonas sp. 2012CJ34-2]
MRLPLFCLALCLIALPGFHCDAQDDQVSNSSQPFNIQLIPDEPQHFDDSTVKRLLAGFPESKRREFIGRTWEWYDSAIELGKQEAIRTVSLIGFTAAGRTAVRYAPAWMGNKYAQILILLGFQSLMDYFSAYNNTDFYFRAGANAINHAIQWGDTFRWWRQALAFTVGHLNLFYLYGPEINRQLFFCRHIGSRRIQFMSMEMNGVAELELVAPASPKEPVELVMYFDGLGNMMPEAMSNNLETAWVSLAKACRENEVTSIKVLPAPEEERLMAVQLWRGERRLTDTLITLESDNMARKMWVTDWIAQKTKPNAALFDTVQLVNPLSVNVLEALGQLVASGGEEKVSIDVSGHQLRAMSPKGIITAYPTGDYGFWFVDRNHSADVELPELWLNTKQSFSDGMARALATLEQQQMAGKPRGIYNLGADVLRSIISRAVLHAGMRLWQTDGSPVPAGNPPAAGTLDGNSPATPSPEETGGAQLASAPTPAPGGTTGSTPLGENGEYRIVQDWLQDSTIARLRTSGGRIDDWALNRPINRNQARFLVSILESNPSGAYAVLRPFVEEMPIVTGN